jgi:hypothetical protein
MPAWILYNFSAIETWAQRCSMRILATQTATYATINHGRYRIYLEWIGIVFKRQCRTAREPHTGMVTVAHILIDTIFHAHHTLAPRLQRSKPRANASLTFKLAFTFGDDDLEPIEIRRQCFSHHIAHYSNTIRMHGTHPFHTQAGECVFDGAIAGGQTGELVACWFLVAASGVEIISCVPVAEV